MFQVEWNAIYRADFDALLRIEMADALGTFIEALPGAETGKGVAAGATVYADNETKKLLITNIDFDHCMAASEFLWD